MRILAIIFIIQRLICESNCSQLTHVDHTCSSGASTEQAGMGSGTLTFDGSICELTITDIPELRKKNRQEIDQVNRLNIVGVRRNASCDTTKIVIDSGNYCIDGSVKDTVIEVTDQQMKFAFESKREEAFTLTYYKGKSLTLRCYRCESLLLDTLAANQRYNVTIEDHLR